MPHDNFPFDTHPNTRDEVITLIPVHNSQEFRNCRSLTPAYIEKKIYSLGNAIIVHFVVSPPQVWFLYLIEMNGSNLVLLRMLAVQ